MTTRADRAATAALLLLSGLLALVAAHSLSWRIQHDSPILFYISFLIDRFGAVPYRDVFDMNMPGTYLAYGLVGRLTGYADHAIRWVDLCLTALTMWLTWKWMRVFGRNAAWGGAVLWGLAYLSYGPRMNLQREDLILLPVVAGVCAHFLLEGRAGLRAAATGLCFGVAATMKPHAAIGLPLLVAAQCLGEPGSPADSTGGPPRPRFRARPLLLTAAGFAAPLLAMLWQLWRSGALAPFIDVARNYWPLYAQLTGDHFLLSPLDRLFYLDRGFRALGLDAAWLAPALLGAHLAISRAGGPGTPLRLQVVLMGGLAACYAVYPLFSGQFWQYHWLPFLYFVVQLAALCLADRPADAPAGGRALPLSALLLAFALWVPQDVYPYLLLGERLPPVKEGRVDEIAAYLTANLSPGDTVQPLDWTGGAVHAMLRAGARIATPFVYDFHFYHHVSSPYIQSLRRRFLADFSRASPRFVVQVTAGTKPRGIDTSREFPELQAALDERYEVASRGAGYLIHRRR